MARLQIDRSHYGFWHAVATRWGDQDPLGHVNNTRFYAFDEDARTAYFGALWGDDPKFWQEYGLILGRLSCDFVAQLKHPATVDIGLRIRRLGSSSLTTEGAMFDGERLVAVTEGVVVWFDYKAQKPARIPDAVRAKVIAREPVTPES
ncbi:MAG: thioesterase family protein [Polycyclovorans sp.]|jgi:acyl-CoA thioester hydrolase|nr:acyl-CoA thioesterase [Gammaproteobacteria bacterium]MDP1542246.1 thioesterase family protein [Polycyclovorans sp.]|tara:strand:- start:23707 stop:24150 length:444 start_codon:yes stop_codon:yes gene_type:complete